MRSMLRFEMLAIAALFVTMESVASAGFTFAIEPFVAEVKSSSPTEFEITYEWWVGFVPTADRKVFVHFTDSKGKVLFKDEFTPDPALTKWPQSKDGKRIKLPARKVKIPEKLSGPFEIRMGTRPDNNTGNDAIMGANDDQLRVRVGQVKVEDGKVVFEKRK
jgi:hypothetical protein